MSQPNNVMVELPIHSMRIMAGETIPVVIETAVATPAILNLSLPTPNTEDSISLPATTKRFLLKGKGILSVGYVAGGPYVTIPKGAIYEEKEIKLSASLPVYVMSTEAEVVEIIAWQ